MPLSLREGGSEGGRERGRDGGRKAKEGGRTAEVEDWESIERSGRVRVVRREGGWGKRKWSHLLASDTTQPMND